MSRNCLGADESERGNGGAPSRLSFGRDHLRPARNASLVQGGGPARRAFQQGFTEDMPEPPAV